MFFLFLINRLLHNKQNETELKWKLELKLSYTDVTTNEYVAI